MKRKSRGEQMFLAAGGALPVRAAEPQQRSPSSSPQEKPAKHAKTVAGHGEAPGPSNSSQQLRSGEVGVAKQQELPPDLVLLGSMFDALQMGRMMLKRRGEKVTYGSVRHVVENSTRREFRVSHLAQMKYLRPESFEWQYIYAPSSKEPKVLELQLLLTFDQVGSTDSAGTGSASRYNSAQEQSDFKARLQAYWQEQQGAAATPAPQVQMAELPAKPAPPQAGGLTPSRSASLPYRQPSPGGGLRPAASCPPGAVPSPAKAFSPLSNGVGRPAAVSPFNALLHHAAGPRGQPPAPSGNNATPTRHRGAPLAQQQPCLGLEGDGPKADLELARDPSYSMQHTAVAIGGAVSGGTASDLQGAAGSSGLTAAQGTPQSKARVPPPLQTTPTSHHDARLARLHSLLSPAALQKIQEAEAAQLAQTPDAKRRGEMKRAVQMLPTAYDLVRSIFGAQGPVVKPVAEVVQSMCDRTTTRQGLIARDASNGLVALARAAPEFVRIEEPRVMADGSARPRSVIIARGVNINAVGQKLRAFAADDDAAVQSLFYSRPAVEGGAGGTQAGAASAASAALQPQNLAAALEAGGFSQAGAGSAAGSSNGEEPQLGFAAGGGGLPQPPRSAKKRPPGLPLPPASPLMRGRATPGKPALQGQLLAPGLLSPSRSHSIMSPPPGRTAPGLMSPTGPSVARRDELGSPPRPSGLRAGDVSPPPPASGRHALPPVPATLSFERTNVTPSKGVRAAGATEAASKGLMSPARTPGRTAVQDALLDGVRRSGRGRRHLEEQLLDAAEDAADGPVKR